MADERGQRPDLRWLEASQNPFGMRVLDCRPVTRRWLSVTKNPDMAERFATLRSSTGLEHIGKTPSGADRVDCGMDYPFDGGVKAGPLFRAQEMEDKWDIYLYDGVLYFARSWSGDLAAIARIEFGDTARITWAAAAMSGNCPDGAPYPIRVVDFLIKSHLHRRIVPHPLPIGLRDDPMQLAGHSMSLFGRWALFATFEDTTTYNPWTAPTP